MRWGGGYADAQTRKRHSGQAAPSGQTASYQDGTCLPLVSDASSTTEGRHPVLEVSNSGRGSAVGSQ